MECDGIVTKDMYLAALLISYGSRIVKVDKTDPKKQFFHFDKLPMRVFVVSDEGTPTATVFSDLLDLQSQFLSRRIFFPPTFIDCLRSVKSHIYSE